MYKYYNNDNNQIRDQDDVQNEIYDQIKQSKNVSFCNVEQTFQTYFDDNTNVG